MFKTEDTLISMYTRLLYMGGSRAETWGLDRPGKSRVAIGFLRNSGTNPSREAIRPDGSNFFSREVRAALCNA